MELFTLGTLIFVVATFINVILQTIRSILTIKASKWIAASMNAIAFGFYVVVIKLISDYNLLITVPVTVICNLIGVCIAFTIVKKFTKDKIWRITVTLKNTDSGTVTYELNKHNISNTVFIGEGVKIIDIYSKSQGESILIKEILNKIKVKYFITEMDKTF